MRKLEDENDGLCWRGIVSKTVFYNDWHEEFLLECGHVQVKPRQYKTPYIRQTVCAECQREYEFNKKQIPLIPADSNTSSESGESSKA